MERPFQGRKVKRMLTADELYFTGLGLGWLLTMVGSFLLKDEVYDNPAAWFFGGLVLVLLFGVAVYFALPLLG